MKKRLLYYQIEPYLSHKNALIITGMRQVGKSTLMRQLFDTIQSDQKVWLDFDNPLDQKIFEALDYNTIYHDLISLSKKSDTKTLVVCIDEIQNYPPATKAIKYLIDHYQIKFLVTGSSNFYLKNLFPESLSGRKFLFELQPMNFQEYLYFQDELDYTDFADTTIPEDITQSTLLQHTKRLPYYEQWMRFGGFPEVVITADEETKRQILKNIFASFFEKDIYLLSDYTDIKELRDLLLLLVPRVGSQLDVTRLASELGVNRPKIYQYLEFLQGTFVIRLLPRYAKGIDKAVVAGKKVYFTDTGILTTIGTVNDAQLFENAVINQLSNRGNLSFFYKKNSAEIDAILDKHTGFEIKLTGTESDIKKVRWHGQKIGLSTQYVVSKKWVDIPQTISPTIL